MDTEYLVSEVQRLREQLEETAEVLEAIRNGRVDALVVPGPEGDRIYTLEGADQSYREMIENMNEGAVVLSRGGTVLYCNRRFAQMMNMPIESVMGGPIAELVEPSDLRRFNSILEKGFDKEEVKSEIKFRTRDQAGIPAQVSIRSFTREEIDAVCMVVTDLTDLKKTENRLKEYAGELQEKNRELNLRADQLSRLSSELTMTEQRERRRLAKILHDHLQQLLVSARFNLETLEGRVHEQGWQTVENVIGLVAESLDISRSLSVELSPPVLYEGGIVPALEWLARWKKEKHGLNIDLAEENARDIHMREDLKILLFSAVRELLLNVAKHAGVDSARVEVSRPDSRHIRIVVSDHGTGFDPIRALGRPDGFASGFGLLGIKERLRLIGGKLQVESSSGHGTSITLAAPIHAAEEAAEGEPGNETHEDFGSFCSAALGPDENSGEEVGNIRVMLVDDHAIMRQGMSTLLSNYEDIEVVGEAPDGEAAVHLARDLDPDVILMDISMPGMNGIEATRIIHSENPGINIIGLSMFDAADQAEAMQRAGAAAYVKKSGNKNELLQTIHDLVGSAA